MNIRSGDRILPVLLGLLALLAWGCARKSAVPAIVVGADGGTARFPATAPALNQTVILLPAEK